MRKHLLLCLVAVAFLAVGIYGILRLAQLLRPGITQENFDRIQEGMTEQEVERILGGPSGYHADRPVVVMNSGTMFFRPSHLWIGDSGIVTICFSSGEPRTVVHKEFEPLPPEPFDEWLRRKLHRLMRW
jgi:hypothetical protein